MKKVRRHTKASTEKRVEERRKKEKKERMAEFKKLYSKNTPYPRATIAEIKKKAVDAGESLFTPGVRTKKYKKGDYLYSIDGKDIQALYLPSWTKRLKVMFDWIPKTRKWELLTYRKGDW